MLITFDRVWAVGRFDVGRSLFVVHNHRELVQSPIGDGFDQSGAHQTATCQKGVLLKLSRDGGVFLHASIPKRGA